MREWDADVDAVCRGHIARICDGTIAEVERESAWQALLVTVAPSIEGWALHARLLRQWNLATIDDARAVLVGVIARLRMRDHENLRRFQESLGPIEREGDLDPELSALDRLGRLAQALDEESASERVPAGVAPVAGAATPFRGWLLTLLGFVVTDHLRARLGWRRASGDGDGDGGARTKRDVGTDASPLSSVPAGGVRPPITDYLTVRRLVGEIDAHTAGFPEDMRRAFALWLADHDFEEIAGQLALESAGEARRLVRAAQARLRKQFRGRWDALRGAA
jgi:hypothetical protein